MSETTTDPLLLDPNAFDHDGDTVYRAHFDRFTRLYLREIADAALIEEHRKAPVGQHSEQLGRVLAYFRRLPPERQYLLRPVAGGYRIIRMAVRRNGPTPPVGEEVFATLEAGYHGIFLLKLKDMMEADNG
jgi:branched-chain amino acid transport system permease protein